MQKLLHPRKRRAGFTLLEVIVASAIAGVVIGGMLVLIRHQVFGFANQEEVLKSQAMSRLVFDSMAKDIRNSGYGTSFYAGLPPPSTTPAWAVPDVSTVTGTYRGFPAIRIANNITSPAAVMRGTDAITALRVISAPARLQDHVPCAPGTSATFAVADFTPLIPCAQAGGIVLISDPTRPTSQPQSVMYTLTVQASPTSNSALQFRNANGIDPSANTGCSDGGSLPPAGMGAGSAVVCVQPVTYWVDTNAQLRLWQGDTNAASDYATGAGYTAGVVPINVTADAVIATGVEDLQVAVLMSGMATGSLTNAWAFTGSSPVYPTAEEQLAEARVVRISALVRTTRRYENGGAERPSRIEDANAPPKCPASPVCYEPSFHRHQFSFQAELRNMRVFDALSDTSMTTGLVRSY